MMFTNIRSIVFVLLITFCVCPKLSFGFDSKQILPDPDCGAKCLYVIFLELGVAPRSYKDFAKELGPAGKEGYSLLQLQNAARSRGLFAESCQLDHKDLGLFGKDPAAILHIVPGHFVILGSYLNNRLIIYDAATGIVSTESAGFLEKWSGRTLLISRNEIKLPTSSPTPILRWWWGLLGIVFVCSLVFSRRYWLNRRFGVFMIAIIPCLAGCETRIIEQAERAIANTEDTSAAAFSISPKVSIEKTVIDAGRLNLTRAPQVLSVPIHNQESTAIEISDVRISCNCLSGRISSKVIEPYGSATLELLLERSKAGPKNAMCTIMCGGHSVSTISVSWIVTADLAMTPDSIADLELGAGQKKEVAIEIDVYDKQNKPSIDVEYKWNLKNNMLLLGVEASTRMVENTCYVSFSVDEKAERQTLSGQLLVRLSGQTEPAGIVPFMITVRTEVNLSPKQLFLTPSVDGSITTQLLIHAEEGETLIPLELFWINGENRSKCNFTKVERDETMIVDVQTNSNEIVGVTELEIVAGKRFVKRIPAFFSSEP